MTLPADLPFLAGGGAAGALIRAQDWSSHPLGPPGAWPQPLKTAVGLMLDTGHPMCLGWGDGLALLYNDAYAPILAARHPQAMGGPAATLWADLWPEIGPLVARALAGEAVWQEDMPLVIARDGQGAERRWTFSWSALRDGDGAVRGFASIWNDETGRMRDERRLTGEREALRNGEVRFRALVNASSDVVYQMSADWTEMRALDGRGFLTDTQTPSVRWLDEYILADDRPRIQAAIGEAVRSRSVFELEHRVRRADGTVGWTFSRAVPVVGADGEIAEWFGMASDVTERKRTEAALADSRATLRAVYDNMPAGLIVAELPSGRLIEANRAVQDILRHPMHHTESVDGYRVWESYDAEGRRMEAHDYPLAHTFATGEAAEGTYHFVRGDGTRAWLRVQSAPIRDASGVMTGGVVAVTDVDEMMRTREALERLTADLEAEVASRTAKLRLFQDIIEATVSPICAFDTDYRLIAFNQAHNDEFRRVNGFDTKLGDVFPDLFIPAQRPVMRALMARALTGERFTVTEEFGRPELGQPLWEISYTPLHDENGALIGAFHLATDISDRVRTEADLAVTQDALRQSQKMEAMGSLTGGVAHDFNNLLTPIVGALDMLRRSGIGGERERRLIAGAAQSAERAKVLVQRLLAFARRQPLQPVAVDMAHLVQGMAELVASTTGPQIKVVVEVAADVPPARADPNQLEMALLNLAVNARDAMPDGGTLRMSVTTDTVDATVEGGLRAGRYIRLSVADTGSGMDAATLARAVEPFFSTKGVGKGTGLGLSMVHGLASQLGGGLTIASTPGLGTNIELWLPQADTPPEPPAAAPAEPARARGTALLVDDEAVVRMSTADMLGDLGYDVLEAASAEEALQVIDSGAGVDLLVTDHLMPGMTGTGLALAIGERRPGLPVLVVSGYADAEGVAPGLPYLTKPFRKDELAASLARLPPGGRG